MKVSLGGAVTVTATERWLSEIRAGRAFGGFTQLTGAAAQFAHLQLFNPAASGKTVILYSVYLSVVASMEFEMRFHDTALLTNVVGIQNLLRGGAAQAAQLRTESLAAGTGSKFGGNHLVANETMQVVQPWQLELGEGEGFLVRSNVAASLLTATWFWVEV